jgi:hypothetical protein
MENLLKVRYTLGEQKGPATITLYDQLGKIIIIIIITGNFLQSPFFIIVIKSDVYSFINHQ